MNQLKEELFKYFTEKNKLIDEKGKKGTKNIVNLMKINKKNDNEIINISKKAKNINKNQTNKDININLALRKSLRRKRTQIIKYNYPPKKNIIELKKSKINSKNKIKSSNKLFSNNLLISKRTNILNNLNKIELNSKKNNKPQLEKIEKEALDDYELNELEYNSAMKLDKRNFIQIYWSMLRREHLIIFTFITKDDHNINLVKYARFIFLLCTDMAMNVFFFSDETMHKMFLDYGKYNFVQQIPQIIYSTIVSQIIEIFICYLSLTDKHYYEIKDCQNVTRQVIIRIMKCIEMKIVYFFLFTILMFVFYWYLIACFCAVYHNTQKAFIKDSISSFVLSSITPFIIYSIPSLLRIISLKNKKYKLECIFKLSNLIPFF